MYFLYFFKEKVLLLPSGVGFLFILRIAYRTNKPNQTRPNQTSKKGKEDEEEEKKGREREIERIEKVG